MTEDRSELLLMVPSLKIGVRGQNAAELPILEKDRHMRGYDQLSR